MSDYEHKDMSGNLFKNEKKRKKHSQIIMVVVRFVGKFTKYQLGSINPKKRVSLISILNFKLKKKLKNTKVA